MTSSADDDLVVVPISRPADLFGEPEYLEVPAAHAAHWDARVWREQP